MTQKDPSETSSSAYQDPLYDPFAPAIERLQTGDGTDRIDVLATVSNFERAQLPRIDGSSLRPGDVLAIDFDDDTHRQLTVSALDVDSLSFGSDDIQSQRIIASEVGPDGEDLPVIIGGSSISPSGTMLSPNTIKAGCFLWTAEAGKSHSSVGTIKNFDVRRPDTDGVLKSVSLNKTENMLVSESYARAVNSFRQLEAKLGEQGFDFADTDDGLGGHFKTLKGGNLLYAARQGFGSGIIPQDEIHVYDSKLRTLRSMRFLPTKGMMQIAVMNGVSKDMFQDATFGYTGNQPDWSAPLSVAGNVYHRLSDFQPFVTYTWLNSAVEEPAVTVIMHGKLVGREASGVTGEMVQDLAARRQAYGDLGNVEIDVRAGQVEPAVQIKKGGNYWIEDREAWTAQLARHTAVRQSDSNFALTVGTHKLRLARSANQDIEAFEAAAAVALGEARPRHAVHRVRMLGKRVIGR